MSRALLIVVAALAVASAACGGDETASVETLDVGYSFGMDVGDVGDTFAFERLRDETGIAVKTRDMGGGPEAVVGLTRGDVQFAQLLYTQLLDAVASGAPIKAVLPQNVAAEVTLVGGDGVRSVEDLRGRTVAVSSPEALSAIALNGALDRAGLSRDDVKVVYMDDSTTRAPALAAGRIDAASLDYGDFERLNGREPGRYTVIARGHDFLPKVPIIIWAVDEEWAAEHSDELQTIVGSLTESYERMYDEPSRARWIAEARRLFLKGEDASVAPGLYDYYKDIGLWPTGSSILTEAVHDAEVDVMLAAKLIQEKVAYDDAWLPDYWRDATDG